MTDFAARNRRNDKIALAALWGAALLIFGLLVIFLGYLLYKGLPVLTIAFIVGASKDSQAGGGVGAQLFNTLYIIALSVAVSLPLATGTAIYLSEYAKNNLLTRAVRISIESLASVPSIVLGLFGMIIFVNYFKLGFSIIGGALALSMLNLPLLARVTEEALRAVPQTYREASLSLGATKWQTIWKLTLPSALPGIMTGLTLTCGRAAGESAILIFTAGTTVSRRMADFDLLASGETLAVHIWYVMSVGLAPDRSAVASGSAALLIITALLLNAAFHLLQKFIKRRAGLR
ncbi:MAG: phosphate ABC transporter permease PstA [Acidaminococcales bacterium]|jgi:phosphate transport system permease protein|nr:phosphate ABC transporter permease PstA [Acidaminococcales bacterium]